MAWPVRIPDAARFVLANAAVPQCLVSDALDAGTADGNGLVRVDITVDQGVIADVATHGAISGGKPVDAADGSSDNLPGRPDTDIARVDLAGCQAWPCFVDMHTHLDKGHIWPRAENADGTFTGAIEAAIADRCARWNAQDVETRFEFGLRAAYAHGTAAVRTHLDSAAPQHLISWPAFTRLRERWHGRIDLQAVTILRTEMLEGAFGDELAAIVAAAKGILGAVVLPSTGIDQQLDRMFALADAHGLALDFHADETGDPAACALRSIAAAKLRNRFTGRVVVGHCCSLATQAADDASLTLDAVAQAGLAIVSLPMCNLFLQDRVPGRTPRWRGITLLHELRGRGIPVALASDNCRDPFYGYGDHDMLEVFTQAARIAHLDRPVGAWPTAVTSVPAAVMGLSARGRIVAGARADLIVFNARGYSELLSRPQSDRIVLRAGKRIDTTLPDYRELDPLMQDA